MRNDLVSEVDALLSGGFRHSSVAEDEDRKFWLQYEPFVRKISNVRGRSVSSIRPLETFFIDDRPVEGSGV